MPPEEHPISASPAAAPRTRDPAYEGDLAAFLAGQDAQAHDLLGAHPCVQGGVAGVRFATWAPHAAAVSVVGDFNGWEGAAAPLRPRGETGVWEGFAPGIGPGARYRFLIRPAAGAAGYSAGDGPGASPLVRPDPYARQFHAPGSTTAVVVAESSFAWGDGQWMQARVGRDWRCEPVAVYEVDLGSWAPEQGAAPLGYRELAPRVAARAAALGFTHVELLPICERDPLAQGRYAAGGLFAPTARFGDPDDFRFFVDFCHRNGIGVLVDWPAGGLAAEQPGLAAFDGEPLYEPDGATPDTQSVLPFDFSRGGVRSLLLSSALFWLRSLHVDGLRIPSLGAMLYLDHAQPEGHWTPNKYGGNENLDAIAFLRELSGSVAALAPGTLLMAAESSTWPQVTRPPWVGGLGFALRWNGGWINDTLEYLAQDPVYRHYHHDLLTLSPLYAFQESYILPLSHEEVGGGKGPLLARMPGDDWQRLANVRLLYTYLWTHPGKKLLFMGGEHGFPSGWDVNGGVNPHLASPPAQNGMFALVRDLNRLYRESGAMHRLEFSQRGFEWVDRHDAPQSIIAYLRRGAGEVLVIALNFTPVPRESYRIGVPLPGPYREVLNSDSAYYGGSNLGNLGDLSAEDVPWMGRPYSVSIVLPPLAGVILQPVALARTLP
jgi:1,4-alpha-glucan branching enzyme